MAYVLHKLHIILSSKQEAMSGDFGLMIVVIMATLIGSLLVFILYNQFKRRLMSRSRARGKDTAHFIPCVTVRF